MVNLNFEITVGRPVFKDYKVITNGMLLYHDKKGHRRTSEIINIFIKDDKKRFMQE